MSGGAGLAREVHFHAGTHKTGTTTIQEFLRRNKPRLAADGVVRVVDDTVITRSGEQRAAHRVAEILALGPEAPNWRRLAEAAAAMPADLPLLLSSERLFRYLAAARTPARRTAITDNLRAVFGDHVRVTLYVRNFGEYFNSLVSERIVATAEARPIEEIVRSLLHLAELRAVTEHLRAAFGADAVRLHSFDAAVRGEGGLVRHFLGSLGRGAPADLEIPEGRFHAMPPPDVLALKYRLNTLGLDESLYPLLRRQASRLAERRPSPGPFRIVDERLIDVAIAEGRRRNPDVETWSGLSEAVLFDAKAKERPYVDLAGFDPDRLVPVLVEFYQMSSLTDMSRVKLMS